MIDECEHERVTYRKRALGKSGWPEGWSNAIIEECHDCGAVIMDHKARLRWYIMSDTTKNSIGGYEYTWRCGNCGNAHNLAGLHGDQPIVNGEEQYDTRHVYAGDRLGCANCGQVFELRFRQAGDGT